MMRKLWLMIWFSAVSTIIGLLYSTIGYADRPTDEDQTIQTAQTTLKSTVKIQSSWSQSGSGFFFAKNKVLTNWHVVDKADTVKLKTADGTECSGKVGYRDEKWDLAVINTECTGEPLSIAPKNAPVGSIVIVTGNPMSFDFFTSKGIINAYNGGWMVFDAYVQHGSSGSPVVNLHGEVVGIAAALAKDNPNIGLGVAAEDITRFLEWNQ